MGVPLVKSNAQKILQWPSKIWGHVPLVPIPPEPMVAPPSVDKYAALAGIERVSADCAHLLCVKSDSWLLLASCSALLPEREELGYSFASL